MPSGNLLVAYRFVSPHLPGTLRDHLYSFKRYSGYRCFYLNLALRSAPRWIRRVPFDAVIFHNTLLSGRSFDSHRRMLDRAQRLKGLGQVRVALPQDEFLASKQLSDFVNDFAVDLVCSTAAEPERAAIYERVDRERTRFCRVLTGYLDERTVDRIGTLEQSAERTRDIGYRVKRHNPWVGRHGVRKGEIADVFARAAAERGLSADISTDDDDVLFGDDWYRFLLSSRYTIGAEGGASILDRDGTLMERTNSYVAEHPDAGFEEVEAACFPGRDGSFALFALSPRHLEACATRTCQVLLEGDYNGVLRPGEHYIELREDLSNLDAVLDSIERDDELHTEIVERAYTDIVASGRYTYRRFVEQVLTEALGEAAAEPARASAQARAAHALARSRDRLSRTDAYLLRWRRGFTRRRTRFLGRWIPRLPMPLRSFYRRLRGLGSGERTSE
jgi:hypothetical protein